MVATTEEIGTSIEIESISWQRGTTGNTSTSDYSNFRIYLGYCPLDFLGTTFMDNYITNTRTLVHQSDTESISVEEGEWFTIELDSPFWYNGVDNLIMEVVWDSGTGDPSIYGFNTPMTPTSLKSASSTGEIGFLSSIRCQFMLLGTEQLENGTFAGIKVLLGQ